MWWLFACGLGLAWLAPRQAWADECASSGPQPTLLAPNPDTAMPRNGHVWVDLSPGCGGYEGGPAHQLRLRSPSGTIPTLVARREAPVGCGPTPCWEVEVIPQRPLPPGKVSLEVRRPVGTTTLSPWQSLGTFSVEDRDDREAPDFEGIAATRVAVTEGSELISPCEVAPAWELHVTLELADPGEDSGDVSFALEQEIDGDWIHRQRLYPRSAGDHLEVELEPRDAWDQTVRYRVVARDLSGHVTVGPLTAELAMPHRPPPLERWSRADPAPLEVPPASRGCSCSLEHRQGSWWPLLLLVAAAQGARRTCRRGN